MTSLGALFLFASLVALTSAAITNTVMVLGGYDGNGYINTAQLYDTTNGHATSAAPMQRQQANLGVATMGAYIYVAGGVARGQNALDSVARYSVASKSWQSLPSMQRKRAQHAVVALFGNIYALGGKDANKDRLFSVEQYTPGGSGWTMTHRFPQPRWGHSAVAVNECIYVFGGYIRPFKPTSSCMYHCPHKEHSFWSYTEDMGSQLDLPTAAVLGGKAYVCGVRHTSHKSHCEQFDPVANEWSFVAPLPDSPAKPSIAAVLNRVVLFGGYNFSSHEVLVYSYSPGNGQWHGLPSLPNKRFGHAVTALPTAG